MVIGDKRRLEIGSRDRSYSEVEMEEKINIYFVLILG